MIARADGFELVSAEMESLFDVIECGSEEAWLAERNKGVGASEVAILLGLSDWASPFSLWARKTGKMPDEASDADYLEWGRFQEDGTAKRYEYRTGRALRDLGRFTILRSKAWPWLFCTLDRIIASLPSEGPGFDLYPPRPWMVGPAPLEIKAPTIYGFHNWDEGAPLGYQAQLQTQLAVTGWRWGSFGAQMPTGKFDAIDVERNEAFIELVVAKSKSFMDCVTDNTWPPVDGSEWTGSALAAMYPTTNGETVELPEEALVWHDRFQATKESLKRLKAEETELKNKFKAAIGPALIGRLPNGQEYKLGEIHKDSYVVAEQNYRQLTLVGAKKGKRS